MDLALPWTSECHKDTALSFTSEVHFFVLKGCVLFSCSTIQFHDKISLNLWPSHCWQHLPFLKNEPCWPLKVWGLCSWATGLTWFYVITTSSNLFVLIFWGFSFLINWFLTVLGLHCCVQAFSSCSQQGPLSSCDARASHCGASLVADHGL